MSTFGVCGPVSELNLDPSTRFLAAFLFSLSLSLLSETEFLSFAFCATVEIGRNWNQFRSAMGPVFP